MTEAIYLEVSEKTEAARVAAKRSPLSMRSPSSQKRLSGLPTQRIMRLSMSATPPNGSTIPFLGE